MALNLQITLGSMTIFLFIPPIHEDGMFFYLFVSSHYLEQWFVVLEELLHVPCELYSKVFYSFCSNCEWQFVLDLALFKSVIGVEEGL